MQKIRQHLTYANVTASLALFLALVGGAYAATSLPKNSVGAKQLKKNAVTSSKIKKNAVTGTKAKNDSLTGADVLESSLGKVPSATAATSADTAANANALGGKAPAAYPSNVVIRQKTLTLANDSTAGSAFDGGANDGTVQCAQGERAIGGGVRIDTALKDQYVITSRPTVGAGGTVPVNGGTADGWRGVVGDNGDIAGGSAAEVFAVCAS